MGQPLDKAQAILFGKFVNAAYTIFKRDETLLHPEPQPGDIPYDFELVAWIIMSDFVFWWQEIPKFYGILCQHKEQKRDFVLALRGTEGWVEWLDDATARLTPFRQMPTAGEVERGFDTIYSTLKVVKRHAGALGAASLSASAEKAPPQEEPVQEQMTGSFGEQLEQLADSLEGPGMLEQFRTNKMERPRRSLAVTGHSLGSALATLYAIENKAKNKFDITTCCTFASPRVGNTEFARQFNALPMNSWRIVNKQDLVPKLPLRLPFFDYQHVETASEFSSAGVVKRSPTCWHSMYTYLHWLDPNIAVEPACKP